MSDNSDELEPRLKLGPVLVGALLFLGILVVAMLARALVPDRGVKPAKAHTSDQPRPIVQIVRPQSGLPDLSALVDRLCPSVAVIVPAGEQAVARPMTTKGKQPPVSDAAASVYSSDGWLLTWATDLPDGPLDALLGDGRRAAITDERSDPVSGLAVVKVSADVEPLTSTDQAFPQVGEFGLLLYTPRGSGCSASASMIGSDFIADGGAVSTYVRLQPPPTPSWGGIALLGSDGTTLGVTADTPAGVVIPAPIASVIADELIRNSLAPSVAFGFRTVDFAAPVADRLGDARSGAAVGMVKPKSPADRAGLKAGDVVVAVGDNPVSSASELNRNLDGAKGRVTLTLKRGSATLTVSLRRSAASSAG